MKKDLAKITSTFLGTEDHGIFTSMLQVTYEDSGNCQGIGGYCLDLPERDKNDKFLGRFGSAKGMQFVIATIRACGAESWEKLPGTMIYVLSEDGSYHGKILGIQGLNFGELVRKPFLFSSIMDG